MVIGKVTKPLHFQLVLSTSYTLQQFNTMRLFSFEDFPGGSDSEESAQNAGDSGLIPGWGSTPGEGKGNPLQYSCLGNPTDRRTWQATILSGVAKNLIWQSQ